MFKFSQEEEEIINVIINKLERKIGFNFPECNKLSD